MLVPQTSDESGPPKRRRWQFSLRSLLVAMTLLAILCGLLRWTEGLGFVLFFMSASFGGSFLLWRLSGRRFVAALAGSTLGGGATAIVIGASAVIWNVLALGHDYSLARQMPNLVRVVGFGFAFGLIMGFPVTFLLWFLERGRKHRRP